MYLTIICSLVWFTLRKRDLVLFLRRVLPSTLARAQLALTESVTRAEQAGACVFFCKTYVVACPFSVAL